MPQFPLHFADSHFSELLDGLESARQVPDSEEQWPAEQFDLLNNHGVLGWVIPPEFGGTDISDAELIAGYEALSAACLMTTFVLTQRNGACQRIAGSENEQLKAELLPPLCRGELFATVGISHLTTSRQHLKQPAVSASETADGFILEGVVPWVTGAVHADYIVTGGTCADGRQVLLAVPTDIDGVEVQEPVRLLALNGSHTGEVRLNRAKVDRKHLIAGPVEQVMKQQGGGAGGLTTSALALGLTASAIEHLKSESERRPELVEIYEPLTNERSGISDDMHALANGEATANHPTQNLESIRSRANSLVLRATQAHLAASKGAGFVHGHPAERAVREAMFFLVWSCPQPVLHAALREFACLI